MPNFSIIPQIQLGCTGLEIKSHLRFTDCDLPAARHPYARDPSLRLHGEAEIALILALEQLNARTGLS
jgi:hypothetical protein